MNIEQELKTSRFASERQKAHLNLLFTASCFRAYFGQRLKKYHLSAEQYNVLRILRGQYPNQLCLKDISLRMIDRNSNTTRIVEKLIAKKLAEKTISPTDRREVRIAISKIGITLLEMIAVDFLTIDPHIGSLEPEEAELLNKLLDKMRETFPL